MSLINLHLVRVDPGEEVKGQGESCMRSGMQETEKKGRVGGGDGRRARGNP